MARIVQTFHVSAHSAFIDYDGPVRGKAALTRLLRGFKRIHSQQQSKHNSLRLTITQA